MTSTATTPTVSETSASERTAVYRFRDAASLLLYVGRTAYPTVRFAAHRRDKEWWPEVADIQITWYPTFDDAAEAEIVAIATEKPKYNLALPDGDGRFTIGVGRPKYTPPNEATAAEIQHVCELYRKWRAGEDPLWEAIAEIRPRVPDLAICELTGVSKATLNRKLGPRPVGAIGAKRKTSSNPQPIGAA